MNQKQFRIAKSLESAFLTIGELSAPKQVQVIEQMAKDIIYTYVHLGGKVLICGNGGSACDAMHFAEELTGRFRKHRKALPAISLTDVAHVTCVGNDYGFDQVFSRGIEAFGSCRDTLIALSTSGNSKNVLLAVEKARAKEMTVLCLLGKDGGQLKGKGDHEIIIPSKVSERIQEAHMTILHILIETIEREMFPENYED